MLPVIALVGRPNVGKSTFFNRLTRSRDAIVADFPGLTRDRQYGQGRVGSRPYIVIDTGGFEPVRSEGIVQAMAGQAELAIEEADCVLFLCDARDSRPRTSGLRSICAAPIVRSSSSSTRPKGFRTPPRRSSTSSVSANLILFRARTARACGT